jgi:ABC-type cobalamin/Fe3+-siderophores transport system ATPase subunit
MKYGIPSRDILQRLSVTNSDKKQTQDKVVAVLGCAGAGKATLMGNMVYQVRESYCLEVIYLVLLIL